MMNSVILINQALEIRRGEILRRIQELGLKIDHPDVLYFNDTEKLGVEAAKKVRQHLNFKPYAAKGRLVCLESAHNLTTDAQNALLKTLEEPPLNALLLLGAETAEAFLPTVLSRCQIIKVEGTGEKEDLKSEIESVIGLTIPERFTFIEKLDEKQEFLEALMVYFREKLQHDPKYLKINQELLRAEQWALANGNIRAILEYLMLNLPQS